MIPLCFFNYNLDQTEVIRPVKSYKINGLTKHFTENFFFSYILGFFKDRNFTVPLR